MMTESKKRRESLSILQRLRQQGTPGREEKMESMFDSVSPPADEGNGEETEERLPDIDMEDEGAVPPSPTLLNVASRKKGKEPWLAVGMPERKKSRY